MKSALRNPSESPNMGQTIVLIPLKSPEGVCQRNRDFLETLAEACQKTGFQVHASSLMRNCFHLVVETPDAKLVAGMRWWLSDPSGLVVGRGRVSEGNARALAVGWMARRLALGTPKLALAEGCDIVARGRRDAVARRH
jgi:hypothetical protein